MGGISFVGMSLICNFCQHVSNTHSIACLILGFEGLLERKEGGWFGTRLDLASGRNEFRGRGVKGGLEGGVFRWVNERARSK